MIKLICAITYVYVNKKTMHKLNYFYYQCIIDFEYYMLTPYKLGNKNYYEQCVCRSFDSLYSSLTKKDQSVRNKP